jgi:FixJ family two-component response regulator
VALIDWGMPDMPGDELADKVRALDADIALVLMSGWNIGERALPTPAFDLFLPKPFGRLAQVRETVAEGVEISRRRAGQRD